eukprot:CAMPEP_0117008714 /NCGR_PEP_ID=MMETSP0472-20121206/8124_1 /TAXON_ID=693140 ORGANISM="Tiarina fusus, Strain LIS" /NCGR_SAMPLE_ID=MMETSP0472 /ASSEMBLY_ACC=CAM_ASM_000603 /LENGTH=255 /DNA_ID=CAMNT_0004710819 /DNA_START=238 /DNA_END=1002 /DNA_ORIENTATION=-
MASSGSCGGLSIQYYPTTTATLESVIFINTRAEINGGALCVYGSTGVDISFEIPGFQNCYAGVNGGALYIRGPGSFEVTKILNSLDSKAGFGGILFAEEFDKFSVSDSEFDFSSATVGPYTVQNGAIYCTSSIPSAVVEVNNVVVRRSNVVGNGAGFYFHRVSRVSVTESYFSACSTMTGIGGALLFNSVDTIEIAQCEFSQNTANAGAAMACVGGSTVANISDVNFIGSISTDYYASSETLDIYTDGSCTDSFW